MHTGGRGWEQGKKRHTRFCVECGIRAKIPNRGYQRGDRTRIRELPCVVCWQCGKLDIARDYVRVERAQVVRCCCCDCGTDYAENSYLEDIRYLFYGAAVRGPVFFDQGAISYLPCFGQV